MPPALLTDQYLNKYSEKEAQHLAEWVQECRPDIESEHILVIPSCAEKENLPTLLNSAALAAAHAQTSLLVIVVVNHRRSAPCAIKKNNKETLSAWQQLSAGEPIAKESFRGFLGGWQEIGRAHV